MGGSVSWCVPLYHSLGMTGVFGDGGRRSFLHDSAHSFISLRFYPLYDVVWHLFVSVGRFYVFSVLFLLIKRLGSALNQKRSINSFLSSIRLSHFCKGSHYADRVSN